MEAIKLKVRKKGIIILPKRLRERYRIEEGSYVIAELTDSGILLRPVALDEISKFLAEHEKRIRKLGIRGPRLGELRGVYLEREFEE